MGSRTAVWSVFNTQPPPSTATMFPLNDDDIQNVAAWFGDFCIDAAAP